MSLKTAHPSALSRLFDEELYLIQDEVKKEVNLQPETLPSEQEEPSFNYLGDNNKYFLILIDQPGQTHINRENQDDLEKILKAMGLELRDTAIVNLAHFPDAGFQPLKVFFVCSRLVMFGIDPVRLQLPAIPVNQIAQHEGVKVLVTYSFEEMKADRNKKAVFWNEMKTI